MKNLIMAAALLLAGAANAQHDIAYHNTGNTGEYSAASTAASHPAARLNVMERELNRLQDIRSRGGWGTITITPKKIYRQGDANKTIKELKMRLYKSGDLSAPDTSSVYNKELVPVVKQVQKRHGFKQDGQVYTEFIKELNVPVEKRISQLRVNMDRLKQMQIPASGTALVANIPEFKLHVYENGRLAFSMPIVVGKESTKTVTFNDQMKHIVFSPYWNVPTSIVRNELAPLMRKDRTYLKRNGYEVVGEEGGLPKIRQKPGKNNSLGLVKFLFPNSHNIYFHDTPAKSLFEARKRSFSHGCIRLAEPEKLAVYLLKNQGWDEARVRKAMNAGKEQWVNLSRPVPVSITYVTSWVDDEGEVNFREDIYRRDN